MCIYIILSMCGHMFILYIVYAQMFCLFWSRFATTRQDPLFKSDLTLLTPTAATPLQIQHDPAMPKSHAEVHCEEMPHAA